MASVDPLKYVLLDFDNTLADTEKHALPSLIDRFNAIHVYGTEGDGKHVIEGAEPLTLKVFKEKFHGMSKDALCKNLSAHYNAIIPVFPLYEGREENMALYYQQLPNGVAFAPRAIGVMEAFRQAGKECCIVTNNPLQRVFAALRYNADGPVFAREFLERVGPRIFEAGEKKKPNPDVYLFAMKQLGATPDQCIAIEDSATGVEAAVKAGIKCIGFVGFVPEEEREAHARKLIDKGATAVIADMKELAEMHGLALRRPKLTARQQFGHNYF
jgi:HAD superfamily hydrolase (TIGR01509 family)